MILIKSPHLGFKIFFMMLIRSGNEDRRPLLEGSITIDDQAPDDAPLYVTLHSRFFVVVISRKFYKNEIKHNNELSTFSI